MATIAKLDPETYAKMNKELEREFNEIRKELESKVVDNVIYYHALGARIFNIDTDERRYGEGAVEKLAIRLGYDRSLLYKAAEFSRQFTEKEVKSILARRSPSGGIMTWSHFFQIVPIKDKKKAMEYVDRIIEEGLSVRDVRALMGQDRTRDETADPDKRPKALIAGLGSLVGMTRSLTTMLESDFEDQIFGPLQTIGGKLPKNLLEKMRAGERELRDASVRAIDKANQLREALRRLESDESENQEES